MSSAKRMRSSSNALRGSEDTSAHPASCTTATKDEDDSSEDALLSPRSPFGICDSVGILPTLKRPRASSSGAIAAESQVSSHASLTGASLIAAESVGGEAIDQLRRKDEEVADLAVFLAKAVGEAALRSSLHELVAFLERVGVTRVLLALKHADTLDAFIAALCQAPFQAEERLLALHLLFEFMACAGAAVLFQESVVVFLTESLSTPRLLPASPPVTRASPNRSVTHWSNRSKKRPSPGADVPQNTTTSAAAAASSRASADTLSSRVQALCPSTASTSMQPLNRSTAATATALSLHALLHLVLEHNRSTLLANSSTSHHVPLLFARVGGLQRLTQLLREDNSDDVSGGALALLEVLTASEVLRREDAALVALVPVLVAQLPGAPAMVQVSLLKVLTNITNLLPSVLCTAGVVASFAAYVIGVLIESSALIEPDEREMFCLCCAINVVKLEARGPSSSVAPPVLTRALIAHEGLLTTLATSMALHYQSNVTERLVTSGYYAILLGALSLVAASAGDDTLRVPVMTAVAAATRGTHIGQSTEHQPMRIVAAIIQEFLLFQSASSTLTKETLLEMNGLVDRIRQHNGIAAVPQGKLETTKAEAEAEADDDDVALGELL